MYIYLRYYLKHFFICGYGVLVFFLIIKFLGSYTVTLTALECTIEADPANGEIKARTGLSWESWGEMITLVLREKGPKLTSVEIRSRPWLGSSSLDSGKNYCNVEEVARYLNRFAPAKPFSYRG